VIVTDPRDIMRDASCSLPAMTSDRKRPHRSRGGIDTLPSGALRIRVYAGVDPLTGKRHYLTETVPAGPRARANAERIRTRLLTKEFISRLTLITSSD
jgi:hypothetical protein